MDVRRERFDAGRDGPDMKVVNSLDSIGSQDRSLDRAEVDVRWRSPEQDVYRLHNKPPRTGDYDQRNERAANRVGPEPSESQNKHAGRDSGYRAEQIAHYMK